MKVLIDMKIRDTVHPVEAIQAHGIFHYECENCGHERLIFLEMGVEERCNKRLLEEYKSGKEHKATPFCLRCPRCGKLSFIHNGTQWLPIPLPVATECNSYFAYGNREIADINFD